MFAWLSWDPNPTIFTIPFIEHPLRWYGLLFVAGLIIGYWIVVYLFKKSLQDTSEPKAISSPLQLSLTLADRLAWFVVLGIIIGARLGHVFFYNWPDYQSNPIDIFKIWEGGLASHGGVVGILVAVYWFVRSIRNSFPEFTYLKLLDVIVVPTGLVAALIRIGNFFNQEIVGTKTTVPWGIVFGHPYDGPAGVPLHPVQLYEATAYFLLFGFAFWLWQKNQFRNRRGMICGIILFLLFSFRFVIESLKPPYSLVVDESFLLTGQYLSIPFILFGAFLIWQASLHRSPLREESGVRSQEPEDRKGF